MFSWNVLHTHIYIYNLGYKIAVIQIQQYDRCIGPCLRFYGNHQCYKNCRKAKYDGGQCDFVKKGEKLPECCCYYNKN